jgi:hypothetical protein
MKKSILFLTIASLFLSCSNSSSNASNNCASINPPSWIQGTWLRQSTISVQYGYKFTANDVIDLNPSGLSSFSRKGQIDFYCSANAPYTITENSSSTSYFLEINWSGIATYNFTKISDNKIELVNDNDSLNTTYYIKQ